MQRFACAALVALTLPALAMAQAGDPLIGDRPDFTESANTISPGRVQFEGGFTSLAVNESHLTTVGEILVRVGVAKNTEARLTLGSYAWIKNPPFKNSDGITDIAVGAKHRFFKNDGLVPETALLASVTLPTGSDGITLEEVVPVMIGAFGWELSDVFALGANAGWSHLFIPNANDRFHTWWGSLSLAASLGKGFGAYFEVYGYNREEKDGNTTGYADVGLTYLINENFQLDARVGQGFNGDDENWFYGLGLVYRI